MKFSWAQKLPMIYQTEGAECGLACLAMIAGYHGAQIDLPALRQRFTLSLRGATLANIIKFASALEFTGRPLRIELEDLGYLNMPCILHWKMDHFVVLKKVTRKHIYLHDPAMGPRRVSHAEASRLFTGVVLELTPTPSFVPRDERQPLTMRDLVGRVVGLKRALGQIFVLAAVLELFTLISPLFLQLTVDKVLAAFDRNLLLTLGIGFMLLIALQSALGALRSWTTLYFGTSLKLQWYANLFSHLIRLPVSFFEKRYFGDIMSRFDGAEAIQRTLTNNSIEAVLDGLISVFVLAVMFVYSRKLALIVLVSVAVYVALRNIAYMPLRKTMEEQIIRMAKQQTFFIETLRGIRTIKVLGREDDRKTRWMNLLVDSTNAQVSTELQTLLFKAANALIFGVQSVAVVWVGATLVLAGNFTVGMLFAFVAYEEQFKARVTNLVDRFYEFRMLSLQVQRLADVALAKPEVSSVFTPSTVGEASIEVNHLYFRYSDTEPWLLEDVSFRVEPGECVAVVGPSGAGKSTLLKLIAGLLCPQSGEVVVNGHPISEGRAAITGNVGFVLQDDTLFAGTIADNIAFASDVADMERVYECAQLACLDDEINAMPMGYSTLVGDMGSALSGGQQQRLLLARALYPKPAILVLDEATSNLDVPTEQRIAVTLAELRMTRIFAAHRPDTIRIADRVINLSRSGKVSLSPAATVTAASAKDLRGENHVNPN
ncbi:MAG TPA: peptidase domain-containing ABC transporter [Candidatus Angelobacter sp.]|nr:peptidase domain-containing ABC transporter [Candidatus Angelobacter sp.]